MELTKRLIKGLPLTAQEGDANWSAIEQALNDLLLAFSSSVDDVTLEISNGVIRIKASGVSEEQLASEAVTTAKIALLAITEALIADGAITGAKIGTGAVIEINLADGSVTLEKLGDGSVTADKIALGAVDGERLAPQSVSVGNVNFGNSPTSSGAAAAIDWSAGVVFRVGLATGANEVTFTNARPGQSITVVCTNPTNGAADITWTDASHSFVSADSPSSPTVPANTGANRVVFCFVCFSDTEILMFYKAGFSE